MSEESKPGFLSLAWFRPLWRRVAVVGIIVAWAIWEWFFNHDQLWGVITLAMLAYGVWTFFINFDRELARQDHGKAED
ncbi:MAG: hypothetical protein ROZ09_10685 [Thiobacillus sp.]|uniref:hypothetical protein n=1 Tax=Thiobacillus sp. TaxID=924 RepID=UPI0028960FFB|nr:hypothetical protein [Thiobacillus sp.]MDT3707285.1 hypothetical protein [Thiobacillus sp.]